MHINNNIHGEDKSNDSASVLYNQYFFFFGKGGGFCMYQLNKNKHFKLHFNIKYVWTEYNEFIMDF